MSEEKKIQEEMEDLETDQSEQAQDETSTGEEDISAKAQETDGADSETEEKQEEEGSSDSAAQKSKTSFFGKKKEKKDKKDQQIADLTDRLQRTMAEFDNYRKRTEKEKASMYIIGAKEIIEKILPVVDNFERGLATAQGRGCLCRWNEDDL